MVAERYYWKMFQKNETTGFHAVISFVMLGTKLTFSGNSAAFHWLTLYLPKRLLAQTVLGKVMYWKPFLAFKSRLNVDLSFSCLEFLTSYS